MDDRIGVLFVCLGNICRSPLAEGVFRAVLERQGLTDRFRVDSCGTGGWHVGEPPDRRSVAVARRHGIDIGRQRARQLASDDFEGFDWIVAMDGQNERNIRQRCPRGADVRITRVLSHAPELGEADVPDPYYGGPGGFDHVYRLLDTACEALLEDILAAP